MNSLLLLSLLAPLAAQDPADLQRNLQVDGRDRQYLLHLPPRPDDLPDDHRYPVVLIFHGGGGNARQIKNQLQFDELADREGFIAVYPQGTGRLENLKTWNAGNCCGGAYRDGVDDVAFVAALLDDLHAAYPIDLDRIYATGMSNGAMLCHRLAGELSSRIAAIAPVAGTLNVQPFTPSRPVPVILFHGTEDAMVPYDGGVGENSFTRTFFTSVPDTVKTWLRVNRCDPTPHTRNLPDAADDGMTVTRTAYDPQPGGAEVVLYTIHGGEHAWPGRQTRLSKIGQATRDIVAEPIIWDFFQAHPRPNDSTENRWEGDRSQESVDSRQ